jgi:hypothetical protein
MSLYVYENWTAKNVKVHKSSCPFCNNGIGTGRNKLGETNGKWHKALNNPYKSYQEAKQSALKLSKNLKVNYKDCKVCKPDL